LPLTLIEGPHGKRILLNWYDHGALQDIKNQAGYWLRLHYAATVLAYQRTKALKRKKCVPRVCQHSPHAEHMNRDFFQRPRMQSPPHPR
jgi:hypothetical protein